MEYLILNEESIPFSDISDANTLFPEFIEILDAAFKNQFIAIRVSEKLGKSWFDINICLNFPLHTWLKNKDREFIRKIKSIISKTEFPMIPLEQPRISKLSSECDFYIKNISKQTFPSLGAAYFLEQLLISFNSNNLWQTKKIEAIKTELKEDELVNTDIFVDNIYNNASWLSHLDTIKSQRKENIKKGSDLWKKRGLEFENLFFCDSTEARFKSLTVGNAIFNQLWKALKALNAYCKDSSHDFSITSIREITNLEISDESESVKKNPKLSIYRKFFVDNEELFFGFHVKNFSGNFRLHFYPDSKKRRIIIGYFGKHLPTKKFNK